MMSVSLSRIIDALSARGITDAIDQEIIASYILQQARGEIKV